MVLQPLWNCLRFEEEQNEVIQACKKAEREKERTGELGVVYRTIWEKSRGGWKKSRGGWKKAEQGREKVEPWMAMWMNGRETIRKDKSE